MQGRLPLSTRIYRLRNRFGSVWPLLIGQVSLLCVFICATLGYMYIEGWSAFDSFYMVVITLSTIGFGEVHPLSSQGRLLTTLVVFAGVGNFAFIIGAFSQLLVDGKLYRYMGRRRVLKAIAKLRDHCIVCGYGRIGSVVAKELMEEGVALVVIENDPAMIEALETEGILHLAGDATNDELLQAAGIERARALVAALSLDSANVYVVLSAHQINPSMTIVARASEPSHIGKLKLAGADRVFLPHHLGGLRMAQSILRPTVTSFIELAHTRSDLSIQMEELEIGDDSVLVGKTLIESGIRPQYNLIIIGVKRPDGTMHFNPESTYTLQARDTLIAVGFPENFKQFQEIL